MSYLKKVINWVNDNGGRFDILELPQYSSEEAMVRALQEQTDIPADKANQIIHILQEESDKAYTSGNFVGHWARARQAIREVEKG